MIRSAVPRILVLLLLLSAITASGCRIAAGIFKAGFWSGIIVVVLIVVGVLFLLRKVRR
jgi:uncharacterized membrane protein